MNNAEERSGNRKWLAMAALLVLVLLVSNNELLRGKVAPQWDAVSFFAPAFSLVADHAKAGRLMLWDPWVTAGSPDFAEPELGATSPIVMLLGVLFASPQTGFVAYWMLMWIGAGIGMLLLARHLRSPAWGAMIAALGFVASGFYVGHAEHTSSLLSVAFLPWILWRFDDALLRGRLWSSVQAGVLYGLSALGGYPQFTILTSGFLGLWALGRLFFSDRTYGGAILVPALGRRRLLPAVGSLVLIGLIGGLIFSPPYSGMITQTRGYSDRIGERSRAESIGSNILPTGAVTTLASPYLFLLSSAGLPGHLWGFSDVSMSNIYSGAVVTILAILALFTRSQWRYWLASLALFFLLCSFGNQLPLRGWLYDYVPPTRYFRGASMFSAYTIFILCILASLAARDLDTSGAVESTLAKPMLAISTLSAVAAWVSFWIVYHEVPLHPFRLHLGIAHLVAVWTAVVFAALLLYLRRLNLQRYAQVLAGIAVLDACVAIFIAGPVMYSSFTVPWWKTMTRKHVASLSLAPQGLYRQLLPPPDLSYDSVVNNRNILVKAAVLDSYVTLRNRFQLASDADPMIEAFALGKNRIWFSAQPLNIPPDDGNFAAYVDVIHQSGTPPLLLHTPQQMLESSSRATAPAPEDPILIRAAHPVSAAPVELLSYYPNSLVFRYAANEDGWLLVTDRWAPGWTAEVNGSSVELFGANFLFRAVRVQRGENTIRFSYRPKGYIALVILSWSVLLLWMIGEALRLTLFRVRRSLVAR